MTQAGVVFYPPSFTPSSFGAGNTTTGAFPARTIIQSERYKELDRRQQYFDCSQHDWKRYDFEGNIIKPGPPTQQPLLSSIKAGWYVPLRERRPSSPYRLGRIVVEGFTNIIFGEQRWPSIRVDGDPDTEDFAHALVKACGLQSKMIRARSLGGAMGTVGLSWAYHEGDPRVEVHNAKHLFVHTWKDRQELIPKHISEMYIFPRDEYDREKRGFVRNWYWFRRDWNEEADIAFEEVKFEQSRDPVWTIDTKNTVSHDDGFCHFVWIQNMPSQEIDGSPDYDGLYEAFDAIDLICSVLTRGAVLNLDPTLVLKMDLDYVQRMGVKKGSDNALAVGESGDASYLELGGTSIEAGLKLFESKRRSALEVAQCVVPDPSEIAASGTSSVAMKVIYAPMLAKADILREQYALGIKRLLEQMIKVAQNNYEVTIDLDDEGNEKGRTVGFVNLPPKIERETPLDEGGRPTGEIQIKKIPRTPGDGGYLELAWGPYFTPTPDDQSKMVTALSLATGAKAFLSKQTASDVLATMLSRDPGEEWRRLSGDDASAAAQQDALWDKSAEGAVGGKVSHPVDLPGGATARVTRPLPGSESPDEAKPPPKAPKPAGD